MEKIEIKKNLEAFVNAENELAIKEANHLIQVFNALFQKEMEEYKNVAEQDNPELEKLDPEQEPINLEINKLITVFINKRKEQKEEAQKQAKSNIEKKKEILQQFKELIATKENIGFLINGIKKIRLEWSEIGAIPRDQHNELQGEFSKLNDEFNYNINIYKALKENDLKVNYSLKNKIIHELKALEKEKKIKTLDAKLKKIQLEWDSTGPTFKEHWEELKNSYWELIHAHYDRIKTFYKQQKENSAENLAAKNKLIEKAKELVADLPKEHAGWEKINNELTELQEKWKSIGPVPKKVNDEIWKSFRAHYDSFYGAKKEFYHAKNTVQKKYANQKKELIEKAKNIAENLAFKEGLKEIKKVQEDWKKIGHAGKFAEQKLWKNFRSQCDAFFNKKDAEVKAKEAEAEKNLELKKSIIQKINAIDPENEKAIEDFSDLRKQYLNSGKSPKNTAKNINSTYEKAVLQMHKKLSGSKTDLQQIMDQIKLIGIKDTFDPEKTLLFEKEKIRKKINAMTKEVLNYENNLGFFSSSKGENPLLKNVTTNIENGKKEIEKLKRELKKLSL
ncbi:MAG: DUF349 domain-containing protein [Parvicellaceae bacterium]